MVELIFLPLAEVLRPQLFTQVAPKLAYLVYCPNPMPQWKFFSSLNQFCLSSLLLFLLFPFFLSTLFLLTQPSQYRKRLQSELLLHSRCLLSKAVEVSLWLGSYPQQKRFCWWPQHPPLSIRRLHLVYLHFRSCFSSDYPPLLQYNLPFVKLSLFFSSI